MSDYKKDTCQVACIKAFTMRCGEFYVDIRWLGGMLTNFKTIESRIKRLKDLERMESDGIFDTLDVILQ